jgi:hypothetical protein
MGGQHALHALVGHREQHARVVRAFTLGADWVDEDWLWDAHVDDARTERRGQEIV